jgi:hypothetical protein
MIEIIDRAKKNVVVEHAYFSDDKVIEAVSEEVAGPFELGLLDKAGAVSGKYVW